MNIPLIKPDLPDFQEVGSDFRKILKSGKITNFGDYLKRFEQEVSSYLGTYVAAVSSGTIGLILTLQALGVKPGERIIIPSFTFMATAQAVLYAGALPLFADVDEDLTLSITDLEFLLSRFNNVTAVIPVHTYGLPCKVEEIQKSVAAFSKRKSRKIPLVYDSAHALGASIKGKPVGRFGQAEVFSLSVTKPLVSVEGGIVSSKNKELIEAIKKMRNYGMKAFGYDALMQGLNAKMSEFHAVIGLCNIRRLNRLIKRRIKQAQYYMERIGRETRFETQPLRKSATHTFKDFTVLIPKGSGGKRKAISNFLNQRGIETRFYFYPPVHQQGFFKKFSERRLPNTEDYASRVITLPFYATITKREIEYVVDSLKEAQGRYL